MRRLFFISGAIKLNRAGMCGKTIKYVKSHPSLLFIGRELFIGKEPFIDTELFIGKEQTSMALFFGAQIRSKFGSMLFYVHINRKAY